ncbi:hypothetical protein C1H76_5040 [Elsinoe australis]|uniref:Uncharacterized protein n=1 Tax=Elsinoe australis TaxID=40998 RepID=A0A4U7AW48_9PEZI|nr:hypothetical protein C1H76_5040 [Elsinoe australis]
MDLSTYSILTAPPQTPKSLTASIPLRCNICPKKPGFSDISHLLTHIASKAHLSTYYKIKVRSGQEDASRLVIDEYDAWYARYRIEDLMSERMNLKEHKRKQKARQASNATPFRSVSAAGMPTVTPFHNVSEAHRPDGFDYHDQVDPLLHDSVIKQELGAESITPSVEYDEFGLPAPTWPTFQCTYNPFGLQHFPAEDDDDSLPTIMSYPDTPSSRPTQYLDGISLYAGDDVETEHDAKAKDSALLKGVIWPGMDLFDSATPEMQRKRNQKKSLDVVDRLEATSKEIEATEVVYTTEIIVQKSRPITGLPHSSVSPVKRPSTPPAKVRKINSRRKPLASRDANSGAVPTARKTRARTTSGRGSIKTKQDENRVDSILGDTSSKPRRGRKPKARTVSNNDVPIQATTHDMDHLNSAFTFQPQFATSFRPAEPTHYGNQDAYASINNPFIPSMPSEPAMLPAWDFLGQELTSMLTNPMFMMSSHREEDDDERTISAPLSEQ